MGHRDIVYSTEHLKCEQKEESFEPHSYGKATEEEREQFILGLNNF